MNLNVYKYIFYIRSCQYVFSLLSLLIINFVNYKHARVTYLNLQKTALTYHIETLKREIQSALHDRDKALKECHDLQERFGEFTAKEESQREGYKSRFEYAYSRERLVITTFCYVFCFLK